MEGRKMERWNVGTYLAVGLVLSIIPSVHLSAQVGHDPAHSPFRDIRAGAGPVFFAGHLSGDRGRGDAGPANGLGIGVRYELAMGRATLVQFSAAYLKADRFIRDPSVADSAPTRRTGPFDTEILLTEVALQLRLTGGKTWHGFAPYLGTGLGMAFPLSAPGDTTGSSYKFGTKFTISAATGLRWHASRKLTVHLDTRMLFWRLTYPISFHDLSSDGGRIVPILDPLHEWTAHPWVSLGVGWNF